jgi:CheY-like chemotaxis protein
MNKHILVVDDDIQMRSILQVVLEGEEYVVDTASDGLIALDKIMHQQAMPEVILMDLNLPRLNGLQLIEALRQREEVWLDSIKPNVSLPSTPRLVWHVLCIPLQLSHHI